MKRFHKLSTLSAATLASTLMVFGASDSLANDRGNRHDRKLINVQIGSDLNSADNPFVQPQDPVLSGGGRDQSLQFGDVLYGTNYDDLQIGRLGVDILSGGYGDDVLIGGLEHFNPLNRDRAFGSHGDDIFIWKPGDGSDFFAGSRGHDVVIFGVVGEVVDGAVEFAVSQDQKAGEVAINPETHLPMVDVSGSPGFCEVIDKSTSEEARAALNELHLNHLVRFSIRGIRDGFESGSRTDENGLRVTLHLNNVETLICTNRDGGEIEVLDLTTTPPTPISIDDIYWPKLRHRLNQIVF